MAIDFPASPTVGQRYVFNNVVYVFTAQGVWSVVSLTTAPATSTSKVTIQKFTTSGTYTPTAGTQFAIVECIGGGASGGMGQADGTSTCQGGGGGGGGYSRSVLTAAQIGLSQPITIGAGGTPTAGNGVAGGQTSFGSLVIAKGGTGGLYSLATLQVSTGGPGAPAGTGDVAVGGNAGGMGLYNVTGAAGNTAIISLSGMGGAGPLGGGTSNALSNAGTAGNGYGAGGSGGSSHGTAINTQGGAGAAGIVIVTEFNIAAAGPQGPVGPMGGTTGVSAPGGRLTLSPTTPVMTTTNANQSTIYYLPYIGNRIPIWDGSQMVMTTIPAGLSASVTDTVKAPGVIGAGKINDWYVWNDGGTIRLTHSVDWASDTSRGGPPGINMIQGIWANGAPITNGPSTLAGTYVGTTRSNGSGTLDWIYGGASAPSQFNVWNTYNRVSVAGVGTFGGTWTYAASAWRWVINGGAAQLRGIFVRGLDEDTVAASFSTSVAGGSGALGALMSLGLDVTTASLAEVAFGYSEPATSHVKTRWEGLPGIGLHTIYPLEYMNGTGTYSAGSGPPWSTFQIALKA